MQKKLKQKTTEPEDKAPVKRVELHAHTNFSAKDSVMNVWDYVSQAEKWGHKAVAITDHGVVQAFPEAFHAKTSNIKIIYGCEGYMTHDGESRGGSNAKCYHITILAKNLTGLKNLYKLVSLSHTDYFNKCPLITESELLKHRDGLMLGSACNAGELFCAVRDALPEERLREIGAFFDYFEIQPIANNLHLVRQGVVSSDEALRDINRRILALGDELGKPTVATSDVHFLKKQDEIYRSIIQDAYGDNDGNSGAELFFRTTEEMLAQFDYLGNRAYEVVVENTNKIADMIDEIEPIPRGFFMPEIDGSDEIIQRAAREKAASLYGSHLPDLVEKRLAEEIESVVNNGYAVMYNYARMMVERSNENGYIVGYSGCLGSSFLAYCSGITEINALPPHYRCRNCRHSEFFTSGEYYTGLDLPDKVCPKCGAPYVKDGFNIPYKSFLDFGGGRRPDICLNFSEEYRQKAVEHTEEIFGKGNVFRCGKVLPIEEKTARFCVSSYFKKRKQHISAAEAERLKDGCLGVKLETDCHRDMVVIIPKGHDVNEFTPVQYPFDKADCGTISTHFEFHRLDEHLINININDRCEPGMLKMLHELTGIDPCGIDIANEKVLSLFTGTEALGVAPEDIGSETGIIALPGIGASFVRRVLADVKPKSVGDLLRVLGLAHGTNAWSNNAKDLLRFGKHSLSEVICFRDDIMIYLVNMGLPPVRVCAIMKRVFKGKKLEPADKEEMRARNVPEWYIDSCGKILYLFPKAHEAVNLVMALRIAWYKIYHPIAFYQTYFTYAGIDCFNYETMACGRERCRQAMAEIEALEMPTDNQKIVYSNLEAANEMYARGIEFCNVDVSRAHFTGFTNVGGRIMPPLESLQYIVGRPAVQKIETARNDAEFTSIEDFRSRAGLDENQFEMLRDMGCLDNLP